MANHFTVCWRRRLLPPLHSDYALLPQCVFEVAKSLGIEIPRSNICGGGAKSPLWRKIFANVLGIPLDMVKTEQGPGYGAAMLAMVGCGKFKSVQEAADKLVEVASTTEPDAELTAKYEVRYQNFKKLYPALKNFFAATV